MSFKRGIQYDGWYVYAGDSNRELVQFVAGADPWDLTGAVVTAQARAADTDPAPALTATVEMTDPPGGLVHVAWDGEAVRALLAGLSRWEGEYDVQVVQGEDTITVVRNKMVASMDITREGI